MRIDSYNKKIASLIVIFPPLILILYAVVSYAIFYSSEKESDEKISQYYKKHILTQVVNTLQTRVDSINSLITSNKNNPEAIKSFLKNIKLSDNKHIIILKNDGTLFYSTLKKEQLPLNLLKTIDGLYEDKDYIILAKDDNPLNYKVISFIKKDALYKNINFVFHQLNVARNSSLTKTIFWLVLIWFLLLFISVWLSTTVYKRLKEYEKSIDDSNKDIIFQSRQAMLGELLPMIAHQWRQPLNKISAVLMRMRFEIMSGHINPQTLDRQSQMIEDSIDLMSQTIDDFRTFYRPKEEPKEVDLSVLVRKAGYFLDELLKRKKIKFNTNLMPVTMKIHANELLQVLINLIKNASDEVPVRGEIDITLREFDDGRVELRVEDNGNGIPEDKLEKIFEAHESSKQASMGLGLYMSKLIIEDRFGGKIKAYNTPRGAGFLIVLYKREEEEIIYPSQRG